MSFELFNGKDLIADQALGELSWMLLLAIRSFISLPFI